jgi:hypothetical protein
MRDPQQAAHALGKLFRYCGENNVLWGTDSIWYGSPQDQIQAFRTFQIAPELRAKHGYPEISPRSCPGIRAERGGCAGSRGGRSQVHAGRARSYRAPASPQRASKHT